MRNLALVLIGVWLGALLASWVAATVNFRTVDRVLGAEQRPELALALVRPIVDLGRSIDFLPRPLPPALARRFGLLHAAFVVSDLAKAALLAADAAVLGRR